MEEYDYSEMTDEEFESILHEIVGDMPSAALMDIPGISSILHEELNNEVLDLWAERHPEHIKETR